MILQTLNPNPKSKSQIHTRTVSLHDEHTGTHCAPSMRRRLNRQSLHPYACAAPSIRWWFNRQSVIVKGLYCIHKP